MDAIRHHSFGPPETLVLEQVADPEPGPGELLVAASAHGVHLLDTTIRRGDASGPLGLPVLPAVPGREAAGTVLAAGPDVDPAWVGRRVVAHLGPTPDGGGYARLVVAPVARVHVLPDGLEPTHAVAMVGTGRTALMVLEVAAIRADEVVVVTAAAGGLGSLLVQSALAAGARVLALAGGPAKVRTVRSVAPDAGQRLAVVDSRPPGWDDVARDALGRLLADGADGAEGADVVLDGVGGEVGTAAARLLRAGGRLVVHGWASGEANTLAGDGDGGRIEVRPVVGPGAPALGDPRAYQERALALAAAGRWRVLVHPVPFAEAARAHRELEQRGTTGKVVLV